MENCWYCGDGGCIRCDSSFFLYDEKEEKEKKRKERTKIQVEIFNEWQKKQREYYLNKK